MRSLKLNLRLKLNYWEEARFQVQIPRKLELGNIMPCPPRLINDNINPNAE
jgi:hypothetical protein